MIGDHFVGPGILSICANTSSASITWCHVSASFPVTFNEISSCMMRRESDKEITSWFTIQTMVSSLVKVRPYVPGLNQSA